MQPPPDEEKLIRTVDTPEFGRMELWRHVGHAQTPDGAGWTRHELCDWRWTLAFPRSGEVEASLAAATADEEAPRLTIGIRLLLSRATGGEEALLADVAARMLSLAEQWSEGSETAPRSAAAFAKRLAIVEAGVDPDYGLDLFIEDARDVFAGHAIQATLSPSGELTRVEIVG